MYGRSDIYGASFAPIPTLVRPGSGSVVDAGRAHSSAPTFRPTPKLEPSRGYLSPGWVTGPGPVDSVSEDALAEQVASSVQREIQATRRVQKARSTEKGRLVKRVAMREDPLAKQTSVEALRPRLREVPDLDDLPDALPLERAETRIRPGGGGVERVKSRSSSWEETPIRVTPEDSERDLEQSLLELGLSRPAEIEVRMAIGRYEESVLAGIRAGLSPSDAVHSSGAVAALDKVGTAILDLGGDAEAALSTQMLSMNHAENLARRAQAAYGQLGSRAGFCPCLSAHPGPTPGSGRGYLRPGYDTGRFR